MPSHVRVFQRGVPQHVRMDNRDTARARIDLKLTALAFVSSTHHPQATAGLLLGGLKMLTAGAAKYVATLEQRKAIPAEWFDESISLDDMPVKDPRINNIIARRIDLKLAAMAYAQSRHGADAIMEFARGGMAMICQAAVRFIEAIDGIDRTSSGDFMKLALPGEHEDCR